MVLTLIEPETGQEVELHDGIVWRWRVERRRYQLPSRRPYLEEIDVGGKVIWEVRTGAYLSLPTAIAYSQGYTAGLAKAGEQPAPF